MIDIVCKKFIKNFENGESLGFNVNEIRVDNDLINDKDLLESYFLDCQCALFMVDITSEESFKLIKELIETIEKILPNSENNNDNQIKVENYLKMILILNKTDLDSERKVSQEDISSFLTEYPTIDSLEISLKTLKGVPELSNKLQNSYQKKVDRKLPTDYIYEEEESIKNPQNCSKLNALGTINCILIGESEVGKSCFLMRYYRDQFSDNFLTTVGIDKETKTIKIKDEIYRLTLWDTAGQERFRSLPIKYYQNADGVFILFDINCKQSFLNVDLWVEDLKKNIKKFSNKNIFLIGNKIDLKREVTKEEAIKKAKEIGIDYFEVSCKINMNVTEVMAKIIYNIYPTIGKAAGSKLDNKKNKNKKGGCCGSGNSKK